MPTLIYIHGFLSSPGSIKALQTKRWLARHRPDIDYLCPSLSPYPRQTEAQLLALIKPLQGERVGLVGSSLGGFWSTWLVERFGFRAVLINPSVRPDNLVERVLGEPQHNFHTGETYRMTEEHGLQFQAAFQPSLRDPGHYWLMVQTGDETLDYRQAVERYAQCRQLVEQGGDHGFQNYEDKIEAVVEFLFPAD